MPPKVLFVDDEPAVLEGVRTMLRKRFDVTTALGPEKGLEALQGPEPFAVVVSDLKMPGMDGVTFLSKVRTISPDTTRMVLTGHADVDVAIDAVNQGNVFRFLTKPCPSEVLIKAIEDGLEINRLILSERALQRKSEEQRNRLENILTGTDAGTWEWNVQTGEVVFNERWAQMAGYTLEELAPVSLDTWTELVHPEDLKESERRLQEYFEGKREQYSLEARMRHKSGEWFWVRDHGRVAAWDEQGKPLKMFGTHIDVTKLKRIEKALQGVNNDLAKGKEFLKAVTNNIPGLVAYWDAELYCEFANSAYKEWFGKTPEQMIGLHIRDFLGPELFSKNEKFIMAALGGDPQHFERTLTKTDGSKRNTLGHYIPDFDGERVMGFFVLVNDVTELKTIQLELEERQRHIQADLEAAAEIQRSLLPKEGTCSLGMALDFRFMPSATIGGDIFNTVCLGTRHSNFYMVDVSGHGVPAALVSVSVAQELSSSGDLLYDKFLEQPRSPEGVLRLLDAACPLERFEKLFSMFYLLYEMGSGILTYCNAGHPPPMLLRATGGMEFLDQGGTLVGLGLGHTYVHGKVQVQEGDMLLAYTDGVSELENPEGEQLSAARLETLFISLQGQSPEQVLQVLTGKLLAHADGRPPDDDISLVCVRFSRA
jgi:PAS domain S-box-containing protein